MSDPNKDREERNNEAAETVIDTAEGVLEGAVEVAGESDFGRSWRASRRIDLGLHNV